MPAIAPVWLDAYLQGMAGRSKPAIFVMQNEDMPLPAAMVERAAQQGTVLMRSPERALRALAAECDVLRREVGVARGEVGVGQHPVLAVQDEGGSPEALAELPALSEAEAVTV